jgi:hypothetical protein
MNEVSKIEIPVEEATAAAPSDVRRLAAVVSARGGRSFDRIIRPNLRRSARGWRDRRRARRGNGGAQRGAPGLSIYVVDAPDSTIATGR